MEDRGGFTRYAWFTSSDATDGTSNRNYLLQDCGIIYVTDDVRSLPHRLWKSDKARYGQRVNESTMIIDMITGIICLHTGRAQESGAAIADHAAALNGKYTYFTPECSKVASRYDLQRPLYIITIGTWVDDQTGSLCEERKPSASTLFNFIKHTPTSEYGYEPIR